MSRKYFQLLTLIVIILLILNLVLLAMNKINEIFFWVTIVIVAVFAYFIMPKLKRKSE